MTALCPEDTTVTAALLLWRLQCFSPLLCNSGCDTEINFVESATFYACAHVSYLLDFIYPCCTFNANQTKSTTVYLELDVNSKVNLPNEKIQYISHHSTVVFIFRNDRKKSPLAEITT